MNQDVFLVANPPELLDAGQANRLRETLRASRRAFELVITSDSERIRELQDRVAIVAGRPPYELLEAMPRLEWYQQWGAGSDWLMRHPKARVAPFLLTNATGIHSIQIAEHALAMTLSLARLLPRALDSQRDGRWFHAPRRDVIELHSSRALVLGYGAIGRRLAEVAHCFGMQVTAVKRTPAAANGAVRVMTIDALPSLLPEADVVFVALPLTDETHGLLGRAELALLKPSSLFVNVGRGPIVDEGALIDLLRRGGIAGAGLDVFEEEPLAADSPLRSMRNVIVTGHYGGESPHYDRRAMDVLQENVELYLQGRPLRNVVDKRAGY
ncbi:MAG TPA: D-2-hydroxyacid dehydrogenase [Longimicrobiales bacterium]|nr:D-2-hydroxyacid dehydrogenase [Longimicrobiales bacterium]